MVYMLVTGPDDKLKVQSQGYETLNEALDIARVQKAHTGKQIRIFKLIKTLR